MIDVNVKTGSKPLISRSLTQVFWWKFQAYRQMDFSSWS